MESWDTESLLAAARERFEASIDGYARPVAYGLGAATIGPSGAVLDTFFPVVNLGVHPLPCAVLASVCGYTSGTVIARLDDVQLKTAIDELSPAAAYKGSDHPNLRAWKALAAMEGKVIVAAFLGDLDDPLVDASDAYFRLHLLSHRRVRPREVNLDGIFGVLSTVVWTNRGPFEPEDFDIRRAELGGRVEVYGVDKFPRMVDYVVPTGVRIADASRVRLGAHLAEGTVVMHEGYCNYNAGTLGAAMVEGRISQGVIVAEDSDVGGGASILGTLSGGGKEVISVGRNCLIGANGGIGISLGDRCTVEAGLYVTAGTVVRLPDGTTTKALNLSGRDDLLFRRNSLSGAVEVLATGGAGWQGLNADLHG